MTRYPSSPMVGCGVIVWKGGQVLLVKRGKAPKAGEWSLPGGRQELGETVRATAVREVREEAGIEIRVADLIDVVDTVTRDTQGGIEYHYTLIDFDADWIAGDIIAGDDAADVTWADPAALEDYGLWRETVRVIRVSAARRGMTGAKVETA